MKTRKPRFRIGQLVKVAGVVGKVQRQIWSYRFWTYLVEGIGVARETALEVMPKNSLY